MTRILKNRRIALQRSTMINDKSGLGGRRVGARGGGSRAG
jgi:hypothetical protein